MFERFTKEARTAVVWAQEEARELRASRVGAEHLLLGTVFRDGCPPLARLGVMAEALRQVLRAAGPLGEEDAAALRSLGIDLDAVRDRAEHAFGAGALDWPDPDPAARRGRRRRAAEGAPKGHIPFAPAAKRALELSLREAQGLGHGFIAVPHLVLGLLGTGDPAVTSALRRLGTDEAAVRTELLVDLRRAA
ncbi:Clp protease N-terminal domain-containing protein [Streptomyces orinoci]|uniref:Clp protease N-terminal domain-containing protein n=1 Tax=Streptomyces orinoci TaxID=67339 RepID=A0ABV3JS58_STRON|nr:Clp protease N-terminal domain-containing protein [Streptomyces orinoci]